MLVSMICMPYIFIVLLFGMHIYDAWICTWGSQLDFDLDTISEHQARIFTAVIEMLRWFAGYQIRNVAVSCELQLFNNFEM